MSTLSGIASKGEKGRSKFQSLDINNLYRGESLEPSQQKSTLPRKHGMQCLGKVPSARRPPANLPSLKSEHSGNDPAISLVPSGGTGWGSKPGETTGPTATTSQPQTAPPAASIPVAAPQPPVAVPVIAGTITGTPSNATPTGPNQGPQTVMQFQQEFPKLSSGDGQAPATGQKGGSDTQYGPGPSLRPQTEGSWIQGGGRNAGQPPSQMPPGGAVSANHPAGAAVPGPLPHMPQGADPAGGRNNLGQCVAPAPGMGPGGPTGGPNAGSGNVLPGVAPGANMMPHMPANAAPHQFARNIMPQFQMYRGLPNFQGPMHGGPGPGPGSARPARYPYPTDNRYMPARPTPPVDEDLVPRPIIKEEELSKMDDIARDAGWAVHDDDIVDYNQQLLFSDDESVHEEETKKDSKNTNNEERRTNERDRDRDNERESTDRERDNRERERDEHREDLREKRPEQIPPRGPPEQRGWQPGRPSALDFRSPPTHGPVAPNAHPLPPHGGPGPAPLDCTMPPVMRPGAPQGQGSSAQVEDEEIWNERRRQQQSKVAMAIERAKQRKEEEEKRFQAGTKQGAARKLQELEQKMKLAASSSKEHHEETPAAQGPEWDKDKDRDRSRTSSEGRDDKIPRDGREARDSRDNRDHRERESEFRPVSQIGDRAGFLRGERDMPRSERDRERDIRSERERDREREMRNERDRKPASRDRHESHFLANLPPRFQRQPDRTSGFYNSQGGGQPMPPQPSVGPPSQGGNQSNQGLFSQNAPSNQPFDPRWNSPPSHFNSGPLTGSGSSNNVSMKPGYPVSRRGLENEGPSSERDRDRERERERERDREREREDRERNRERERDRERDRELDDRDRDRDRPPSRDPRDTRDQRDVREARDMREPRDARDSRDLRDGRDSRDVRDMREMRDPRDPRDSRDRRDRLIGDIHDRFRSGGRDRDARAYPESGNARKTSGSYYDGPPEYARSYSRGSQEYDGNDYGRGRDRDAELDSRDSNSRDRDSRLGRDVRDRDGRIYDDRRDTDMKKDIYDRHESCNDWREKDRKILDDREKMDRRDVGDARREREDRPQRPDSRDSRTSRESRNSRDSAREERSVHENDHKLGVPGREMSGSWSDDHYMEMKEEKKKSDFFREERRDIRHPPGPITREKLEAAELRNDTKRNLTPLKRSTSMNSSDKKQELKKTEGQVPVDKGDRKSNESADVWSRNASAKGLERPVPDSTTATVAPAAGGSRFADAAPGSKVWSEQAPLEEGMQKPAIVEDKTPQVELKKEGEKDAQGLLVDLSDKSKLASKEGEGDAERPLEEVKKEEAVAGPSDAEPKREKSSRSRSRGGRGRSDARPARQSSGSYAVYRGSGWGGQRDLRGRRGLNRPPTARGSNAGEWTQATESEQSGDEASAESSKEDASRGPAGQRRSERDKDSRRPPRSPKQGQKKSEKEEKNREARRTDTEKGTSGSDTQRYDKRGGGYDNVRGSSSREGFAPIGEPSRRGRGGAFRPRGSVGRRMDGYGPPPSKSPFGQPSEDGKHPGASEDPKLKNCDGGADAAKEDLGGELVSNEDKTKLKLQALAAGVIGSGARQYGGGGKQPVQVPPRMQGKSDAERRDSSRSKSRRGGSSGRGAALMPSRADRASAAASKQNSSDVAEDWETTSEHSEGEEHEETGARSVRKAFPKREGRRSRGSGSTRPLRAVNSAVSPSGRSSRPGAEKRPNGSNANNGFPPGSGQRVPGSGSAPQSNGRALTSRNGNPPLAAKVLGKDTSTTAVNRVDEMKMNEPGLVNQAITDMSMTKKSSRVEKEKSNALDGIDLSNFASVVVVDDQPGVTLEEERFNFDDADNGFQEVRSKKKDIRQKEEMKVPAVQPTLPPSASQAPQPLVAVAQQQQVPLQRSSSSREKDSSRQKSSKQNLVGPGGQIPSPIPLAGQPQPPQPLLQPIQNLQGPVPPSLQGPPGGSSSAKSSFDRQRNRLPPRLAKQRETNRMQKQQQQQQQQHVGIHNDVSEMNKLNQSVGMFPLKDAANPAPPPVVNAWDKPINATLRPNSPSTNTGSTLQIGAALTNPAENCGLEVNEQAPSGASSQRSTPSGDKVPGKLGREVAEKTVLDGTSPPVQTIIFENTNYKSAPGDLAIKSSKFSNHLKNSRIDKGRERKLGEDVEDVQLSFANKNSGPVPEMNKMSDNKTDPIQVPIPFNKNEDSVDMKLDFTFDPDLSQLTDDKKHKGMGVGGLPRSMHLAQGVQSTISHGSTDELDFKIASVKKVWEIMPAGPPVIEHNEDGSVASTASSFMPTFGNPVDSALDLSFSKGIDGPGVVDDGSSLNPGEVVYSYSGNVAVSAVPNMVKNDVPSTSSNVCKVKPQQQAVMSAGPSPIGHPGPLSPPPFNSSNTQQGHINYQPTLGGTAAQFGSISAIPSPPTVLSYSSQQLASQGGLYGAFQLDGTQVLSGQARSQFSGFPPYGLNQGLGQTSAFNQQSVYLQTAPHPPPSAAPDIYSSSLSQYRIPTAQGPFGQSQQLSNNPSTVLISSTSNSLMSASVKPSSQQIGAIGSKGGGPYQQSGLPSAPQHSQLYIPYPDPNYLSGSQMVQRPGPVQSNVVPTIPHSSSFYSGSAGGQAGFYQATNSTLQQGPTGQPLHQTGSPYGLQGYGTQSGTTTPVGLQGFGSQMAQQYRSTNLQGHTFLKSSSQHPSDHSAASNGRTQLKSPSNSQQDVLASVSVFSSGPQIPSPKSRSSKQQQGQQQQQQQQQQSPNQQQQQPHHKYSPYQGMSQSTQLAFQQSVRGQMNMAVRGGVPPTTQRYPQPIQRPVPFPGGGGGGSTQGTNSMGGRHRPPHQQPSRQPPNVNKPSNNQPYYGSHGGNVKIEAVPDVKPETAADTKLPESVTSSVTGSSPSSSSNSAPGSGSKPVTSVATPQPDHKIVPAENGKEETAAPVAE